ncbi:MAG: TetR/AcrR family transcriptional regulator [Solirubrobacteraceae bacterium]
MNYDSFFAVVAYRRTQRTDLRLAATRERIVDAALDLVSLYGYRTTMVGDVAARAGVATGSVYRHFPSKGELFAEVFRRASQREVDATYAAAMACVGDASARVACGVETFASRALRGRTLAWALLAEPVDPAVEAERLIFRRAYRDNFAELIEAGVARGELPPQNAQLVGAALVGALGEALVGPLSGDAQPPIGDLIAFCIRAITNEERACHGHHSKAA